LIHLGLPLGHRVHLDHRLRLVHHLDLVMVQIL
jgi:hypothetical protein